jgi:hypothetical protein
MTLPQAVEASGLSAYTLKAEARKGSFEAVLPRGKRGGYEFDPESFRIWMIRRRIQHGNAPARARAQAELAALTNHTK